MWKNSTMDIKRILKFNNGMRLQFHPLISYWISKTDSKQFKFRWGVSLWLTLSWSKLFGNSTIFIFNAVSVKRTYKDESNSTFVFSYNNGGFSQGGFRDSRYFCREGTFIVCTVDKLDCGNIQTTTSPVKLRRFFFNTDMVNVSSQSLTNPLSNCPGQVKMFTGKVKCFLSCLEKCISYNTENSRSQHFVAEALNQTSRSNFDLASKDQWY